jgi:hypothetical protein
MNIIVDGSKVFHEGEELPVFCTGHPTIGTVARVYSNFGGHVAGTPFALAQVIRALENDDEAPYRVCRSGEEPRNMWRDYYQIRIVEIF